jgi:ATP-dependent exoDNAse (exonuclease V) beta subunit
VFKSRDSVLNRPNGDPATARTVCPGEHRLGADATGYSVVWWSPEDGVLALGAQAPFGLRRDDLIVKEVAPEVVAAGQRAYRDWRNGRDRAIAAARVPSVAVKTATEAAIGELPLTDIIEVEIAQAAAGGERPGGPRFGTLVHAMLADVPLSGAASDVVSRLAAAHGRMLGAEPSEVAAAGRMVEEVLAHPLLRAAAQAADERRCYRETPVTWRLEDGTLVEGNVDLAYESAGAMVVIDFKTDRELHGAIDRYRRQVQIYASAIAAATGRPARAVLMRI